MGMSYFQYWAKTLPDGKPGISVYHHTLNVGHVARLIAESKQHALQEFGLQPDVVAVLAALHDIGKISHGFQSKCPAWLEQNGLKNASIAQGWQNFVQDHSKVSQFTVEKLLFQAGMAKKSAMYWAVAPGAHHGRLHKPGECGLQAAPGMTNDEWEQVRQQVAQQLIENLGALPTTEIGKDSPHLWWLAGLISVADWIGSDESFFPVDQNLEADESRQRASNAIETIGFGTPEIRRGLMFEQLFPFAPNDLQLQALDVITEPGIYVIEAPMGMGKTEAALACAYRLISEGKATGIYFALPTQVTSNRIHLRVDDFIRTICPDSPATRLIHANAWLLEDLWQAKPSVTKPSDSSENDARAGRDWFASSKRAIIAPFGVGTVDQALLGVVAAKHFFVRRFGLAGKVVILDEVHSYDFYTGTLIRVLCETLEALGCTVILLSATLTPRRRAALLGEPEPDSDAPAPYPLITGRLSNGAFLTPCPADPPEAKIVHVSFVETSEALQQAWEKACAGACVLWICDTVNQAQSTYRRFQALEAERGTGSTPALGLLHSRFPYFRREKLETHWMEAMGKDGETKGMRPAGCILVSTQVVEQSVDLDADLLVTELAPTDMLLQRMGRLWRHPRSNRPVDRTECWILRESASLDDLRGMSEKKIVETLGSKAWVYAPYVLLRSLEVWSCRSTIELPSHIRDLLEATYAEREKEPQGWLALQEQILGDEFAKKKIAEMNSNIWNPLLDDQEGVQTRVTSVETVSLILATSIERKEVVLLDGERAILSDNPFLIATARALHKNLVKVPKNAFKDFRTDERSACYVKGKQAIALVQPDGGIQINGLKEGVSLYWDINLGLEIRRGKGELDNESCD
jgi:CRISPR-associated endonuclease/helicase Cas3